MSATPSHIPAPLQSPGASSPVAQWLGQPPLSVLIVVGTEGVPGADDRVATFTVVNLAGEPCRGLFLLDVIVGTAADGGPAGTQTVAWTTGTARTVVANQQFEVVTSADGIAVATVNVSGAGGRHIRALVRGVVQGSGLVSWS